MLPYIFKVIKEEDDDSEGWDLNRYEINPFEGRA